MAEVFLARMRTEAGFERLVAIKRLLPERLGNQAMQEMFIDEARISAQLRHSNIAQTLEFGKDHGYYFIVMDYVHGLSLHAIAKRLGSTQAPHAMAAFVIARLCEALQYAHTLRDAQGHPLHIVHRDLSPTNVLISNHGEVKLIDFGIARAERRVHETTIGSLKGSIGYMSPEQVDGERIDHRSDIFVAGTLLFELLVGRNPFTAKVSGEMLRRTAAVIIDPPSWPAQVAPDLARVCARALERLPADRYPSAGEMQEDLDHHCHEQRYGSRQLADFMASHFPELGRELVQLETASRALGHLPRGGTQAESRVELAVDSGAPRDADLATVVDPGTVATSGAEREADSGGPQGVVSGTAATVMAKRPGITDATVLLRRAPVQVAQDTAEENLDTTRHEPVAARSSPEAQQLQQTDPVRARDRARRRRQRRVLLGFAGAFFVGVPAVIIWIIGFGGVTPMPVVGDSGPLVTTDVGSAPADHAPAEGTPRADVAYVSRKDAASDVGRGPRKIWRGPRPRPGDTKTPVTRKKALGAKGAKTPTQKKALGDEGAEW